MSDEDYRWIWHTLLLIMILIITLTGLSAISSRVNAIGKDVTRIVDSIKVEPINMYKAPERERGANE